VRETGANCSKSKTCWIGICERTALRSMSGIAQRPSREEAQVVQLSTPPVDLRFSSLAAKVVER
jgi:hypothetical protein